MRFTILQSGLPGRNQDTRDIARSAPRLYFRIGCFTWTSVVSAMAPFCLGQQEPVIAPPAPVVAPKAPETKTQTPERMPGPAAHTLTKTDVEAWLDGFLPYALQRGDIAGAVVVVVKDGAVLIQKGYGYSDVGGRKPVDPERTLFRPGSVSKLFTWTAVMQLVEQGKLDLDTDINTYLDFKIPPRQGAP
ncbi:MAG TPA: serine hydrolase domain-containing protein, partial [Chthoniobacterales bacterium]|nr:serine hydrolase domain-containing protein [Chthoniobacterales bacterium]